MPVPHRKPTAEEAVAVAQAATASTLCKDSINSPLLAFASSFESINGTMGLMPLHSSPAISALPSSAASASSETYAVSATCSSHAKAAFAASCGDGSVRTTAGLQSHWGDSGAASSLGFLEMTYDPATQQLHPPAAAAASVNRDEETDGKRNVGSADGVDRATVAGGGVAELMTMSGTTTTPLVSANSISPHAAGMGVDDGKCDSDTESDCPVQDTIDIGDDDVVQARYRVSDDTISAAASAATVAGLGDCRVLDSDAAATSASVAPPSVAAVDGGGGGFLDAEPSAKRQRRAVGISLFPPSADFMLQARMVPRDGEGTPTSGGGGPSVLEGLRWAGGDSEPRNDGGGDVRVAAEDGSQAAVGTASMGGAASPDALPQPSALKSRSLRRGRPAGSARVSPANGCLEVGCKRTATHGNFGEDKGSYCAKHGKERGLKNIVTPRCRYHVAGRKACPLWPAFGRETDKSPTYCAQHALAGMKNINNPRCRSNGCERWPSYGTIGTKTPIYCVSHKIAGMVDVVKPRCRHDGGCGRRPSFGWPPDKVPTYCRSHKPEGMIDVANPRCTHDDCHRRPSFGINGQRASRCAGHKIEGMVDVIKPRCRTRGCNRIAYYKVQGTKGTTRCSQHQDEGMVRSK